MSQSDLPTVSYSQSRLLFGPRDQSRSSFGSADQSDDLEAMCDPAGSLESWSVRFGHLELLSDGPDVPRSGGDGCDSLGVGPGRRSSVGDMPAGRDSRTSYGGAGV